MGFDSSGFRMKNIEDYLLVIVEDANELDWETARERASVLSQD